MYIEDYFRDVTQEDILALLPVAANPEEDDAFTVPFLGRDPRGGDRPSGARSGQPGANDDGGERRGRASSADDGFLLPPGGAAQPPQAGLEPLLQGCRPDGRPAATMLDACSDEEARAFAELAQQMGLLDEDIQLQGMERAQLDALLHRVGQIGAGGEEARAAAAAGGEGAAAGAGAGATTSAEEAEQQDGATTGQAGAQQGAGAGGAAAPGEDDTNSSSRDAGGGLSKAELLRAATGDFVHPYLKRILERPVTAYVLNPTAGNGSLLGVSHDDEEEAAVRPPEPRTGPGRGRGRGRGDGSLATPGGRGRGGAGGGLHASMSLDFTPLQAAAEAGGAAGGAGLATAASTGALSSLAHAPTPEPHQLPPLPPAPGQPPQQPQQPEDAATGATPGPGSTADKAAAGGAGTTGPRGGRARTTVNYSALAGRKDKDRERELRIQEDREARERAKSIAATTQKIKRKPGPKPGSSWSAGTGGPGKPASNNPLSGASGKAPLLFKEDPTSSAVAAAVAAIVAEGGAEGDLAAQWAQLDAGSDVLGLAPDDEVLAEMLALQSELAQQAAINRARAAAVLRAALADIGNQRALAAQRAEWEDLIRGYLLRKAEAKRNAKREKREMEKRQAVAALHDAASPKVGRPKKLVGALASGGYDLMMMEGGDGGEAWRGATPGGGGAGGLGGLGEGGAGAEIVLPGPGEYETDCLAQRWVGRAYEG
ncbi:hypothetical protein HXX76_015455 [Chlamydomonas incerta]|uniref:Uncharacterized protein n=1 Tax=Chlamydomonas incerta TaxID=51695 RepID=A0A835S9Q6_CHLIN|nr:hypothetical protein HXX76_015455 [Chlamydomonas incerta]|eukprot:KAG2423308.1 hypothetical protein HXX76_015455 [Chlamydomonas incerta]